MICKACQEKNLYKAHYCKKCGNPFSEEDRRDAYDKTIYGILNKIGEIFSWVSLDKVTGSIYFKIISILAVLGLGIFNIVSNGNEFKIMESEQYKVQYNTKTKEYYLISDDELINVSLYLPKEALSICVNQYDSTGVQESETQYDMDDKIVLEKNKDYYEIEAVYETKDSEKLTIRLFDE